MFGLSMKEKLMRVVKNCINNNLHSYETKLKNLITVGDSKPAMDDLDQVHDDYRSAVYQNVLQILNGMSPNIEARFRLAFLDPPIAGLPEEVIDSVVGAGTAYGMAYWAITDKKADTRDIVGLNHYQHDQTNAVLEKLDQEFSKI